MGWDAFATRADGSYVYRIKKPEFVEVEAPEFEEAHRLALLEAGSVDGMLRAGGLDCSGCGDALERATGKSVYHERWTPEEVKQLAATADWSFPSSDNERWYKYSAKEFLRACAEHGFGITFSW